MDWTLLIATWGALTGSLALGVSVLTYRRDRARLQVECSIGVTFSSASTGPPMVVLRAVNVGRRPVRLESAGFIPEKTPKEKLVTFGDLHTFPLTLGEGEKVSVDIKPASVHGMSVEAGKGSPTVAYFQDSAGRLHKARVPKKVLARIEELAALGRV